LFSLHVFLKKAKKYSEGARFCSMLSKIHSYRLLCWRFCPLGKVVVAIDIKNQATMKSSA